MFWGVENGMSEDDGVRLLREQPGAGILRMICGRVQKGDNKA